MGISSRPVLPESQQPLSVKDRIALFERLQESQRPLAPTKDPSSRQIKKKKEEKEDIHGDKDIDERMKNLPDESTLHSRTLPRNEAAEESGYEEGVKGEEIYYLSELREGWLKGAIRWIRNFYQKIVRRLKKSSSTATISSQLAAEKKKGVVEGAETSAVLPQKAESGRKSEESQISKQNLLLTEKQGVWREELPPLPADWTEVTAEEVENAPYYFKSSGQPLALHLPSALKDPRELLPRDWKNNSVITKMLDSENGSIAFANLIYQALLTEETTTLGPNFNNEEVLANLAEWLRNVVIDLTSNSASWEKSDYGREYGSIIDSIILTRLLQVDEDSVAGKYYKSLRNKLFPRLAEKQQHKESIQKMEWLYQYVKQKAALYQTGKNPQSTVKA